MPRFLSILYLFFKGLVRVSRRVFYSRITVINWSQGNFSNPCIVVSNHPSTVLDPLHVAVEVRKQIFFLANAALFKNPVLGWIMDKLYCIPIERKKDTGGQPLNNTASFDKAGKHLAAGGVIYVAPEGDSYMERRLRKIKTGTARIALSTEAHHGFGLGLTILPVGLNYSAPARFRSTLLTILGEPIRVADFRKDWEADEVEAVQNLSAAIAAGLSRLMIDTENAQQDRILQGLEVMAQHENPLEPYPHFQRTRRLQEKIRQQSLTQPGLPLRLHTLISHYFETLKSLKITDASVKKSVGEAPAGLLAVAFPVFVLGYVTHFFPAKAVALMSRALNKDPDWAPTFKYMTGLVLYPLVLALEVWAIHRLTTPHGWLAWVYLLAIVPAGLVAEWWAKKYRALTSNRRALAVQKNNPETWKQLTADRRNILELGGI